MIDGLSPATGRVCLEHGTNRKIGCDGNQSARNRMLPAWPSLPNDTGLHVGRFRGTLNLVRRTHMGSPGLKSRRKVATDSLRAGDESTFNFIEYFFVAPQSAFSHDFDLSDAQLKPIKGLNRTENTTRNAFYEGLLQVPWT